MFSVIRIHRNNKSLVAGRVNWSPVHLNDIFKCYTAESPLINRVCLAVVDPKSDCNEIIVVKCK